MSAQAFCLCVDCGASHCDPISACPLKCGGHPPMCEVCGEELVGIGPEVCDPCAYDLAHDPLVRGGDL